MSEPKSRRVFLKAASYLPVTVPALISAVFAAEQKPPGGDADRTGGKVTPEAPGKKLPAAIFHEDDLQAAGSVLPFVIKDGHSVMAAAPHENMDLRGYVIKLRSGEIVAYGRTTKESSCVFQVITEPRVCHEKFGVATTDAVLACACHNSAFDARSGTHIAGPQMTAPVRLAVKCCHDKICVLATEHNDGLCGSLRGTRG